MLEKPLKDITVGIVGVGMVGGALSSYFDKVGRKPFLYDPHKDIGSKEEVNKADIVFLCVPTPFVQGKGFDLSYVEEQTMPWLEGEKIIVIKSTVIPGTTEKLQEKFPQHKFIFSPEFLTEMTADQDMAYPDRQIVGYTKQSYNVAADVMRILPLAPYERIMPATEAEMVKYYGNTWFSIKVTFANQMYDLCQKLGIDYDMVKEGAAADKRIGPTHLEVMHKGYRGYGGKCLVKDIRALIQFGEAVGIEMKLHKIAEAINNALMEEQGIDDPESFSKRE